ncbi:MAG: hypothetical protein JKY67_20880 [Pseudomonadales bacterium]|nr:hypothetical protein [Pseudomonadales bacterium]
MRSLTIRAIVATCLVFSLVGCETISQGFTDDKRGAVPVPKDHYGDSVDQISYVDQNWSPSASLWFYNTTQGSRLIPYDIFLHLEQPDSKERFRSNTNMSRFRYLPQAETFANPDGLPVGWVKDKYSDDKEVKEYVGLTCAACHTAQINYNNIGVRIDGAPAMADMDLMLLNLEAALEKTKDDEVKLKRLRNNIGISAEHASDFEDRVARAHEKIMEYNSVNSPSRQAEKGTAYGYARLDAFGRIFNRILGHLTASQYGEDTTVEQLKANSNPANAPVSYPFLWDTPQHDFVQWNGVLDNASNFGLGALGRNTSEVLGVFATFEVVKKGDKYRYPSSADTLNLARLERHIKKLWSPLWNDAAAIIDHENFKPIDETMSDAGKVLFDEYQCGSCHEAIQRDDKKRLVVAQMATVSGSLDSEMSEINIGTDPRMAFNTVEYKGSRGILSSSSKDVPIEKDTPILAVVQEVGKGILTDFSRGSILEKIYSFLMSIFDNPIKDTVKHVDFVAFDEEERDQNKATLLKSYKGRPLNGIWATAPFLHNGSVPNLSALFLPSECGPNDETGVDCRPETFAVGQRQFDPEVVGFVSNITNGMQKELIFNTNLVGNSNRGHEYAAGVTPIRMQDGSVTLKPALNPKQRLQLVEYLKSL